MCYSNAATPAGVRPLGRVVLDLACTNPVLTATNTVFRTAQSFSLENPIEPIPGSGLGLVFSIPDYERIVTSSIGLTSETYILT
jgi:hypothetical protein